MKTLITDKISELFKEIRYHDYYKQEHQEQDIKDLEYLVEYVKNKGICSHFLEERDYQKVKVKNPSPSFIKNSLEEDLE